jgi:hypothetical protein
MPHVDIPQDLFQQILQVLPPSGNTEQFIAQAVREKLASNEQREEFLRLSDITKQAMLERGLTEEELLEDFEERRRQPNNRQPGE